jgi:hypothetical protein
MFTITTLALVALAGLTVVPSAGQFGTTEGKLLPLLQQEQCPMLKARFQTSDEAKQLPRTAIASYPRSGNSLVRSIIEAMSGVLTGSDMNGHIPGESGVSVILISGSQLPN